MVYKEEEVNGVYDDIDVLREIDVIRTSNNDDTAFIEGDLNTTINFLGGEDKAIIVGDSLQKTIDKMKDVELIEWRKQGNDDEEPGGVKIFKVIKAKEDKENSVFVNEELKEINESIEDWYISYLESADNEDEELEEWISVEKVGKP